MTNLIDDERSNFEIEQKLSAIEARLRKLEGIVQEWRDSISVVEKHKCCDPHFLKDVEEITQPVKSSTLDQSVAKEWGDSFSIDKKDDCEPDFLNFLKGISELHK